MFSLFFLREGIMGRGKAKNSYIYFTNKNKQKLPVPAPSSIAVIPSNSDEVKHLCNTKSVRTNAAFQTCSFEIDEIINSLVSYLLSEIMKTIHLMKSRII